MPRAVRAASRAGSTDDGRFFAHVFAHRQFAYPFEPRGASDWMARYFFTGGMMPSDDLFLHVQDDSDDRRALAARRHALPADRRGVAAELRPQPRGHRSRCWPRSTVADEVTRWRVRWRVFFMACAEMFGYRGGQEWGVSHYLFQRRER